MSNEPSHADVEIRPSAGRRPARRAHPARRLARLGPRRRVRGVLRVEARSGARSARRRRGSPTSATRSSASARSCAGSSSIPTAGSGTRCARSTPRPRPRIRARGIFRRLTMTAVDAFTAERRRLRVQHAQRQQPARATSAWAGRRSGASRSSCACAGVSGALRMRALTCAGPTLAGRDDRRAPKPARSWPMPACADLLASARNAPRLPDGAHAGLSRLALRPAGPRLPGDRDRRRSGARSRGVPAASPRRSGRGRDLRRARAARRRGTRRELLRRIARDTGADYGIRISGDGTDRGPSAGYIPFPRQGPVLTWRPLADSTAPPGLRDLDFVLGDVELL